MLLDLAHAGEAPILPDIMDKRNQSNQVKKLMGNQ